MAFVELFPVVSRVTTLGNPLVAQVSGARIPVGAVKVTLRPKMSQATRNNVNARIYMNVYKSFDDGITWRHDAGFGAWVVGEPGGWTGGTGQTNKAGTVVNPAPMIVYQGASLASIRDARVRLEVDVPVQIAVGLEAEIL